MFIKLYFMSLSLGVLVGQKPLFRFFSIGFIPFVEKIYKSIRKLTSHTIYLRKIGKVFSTFSSSFIQRHFKNSQIYINQKNIVSQ